MLDAAALLTLPLSIVEQLVCVKFCVPSQHLGLYDLVLVELRVKLSGNFALGDRVQRCKRCARASAQAS